jgi:PAS domain S-box-containing protein
MVGSVPERPGVQWSARSAEGAAFVALLTILYFAVGKLGLALAYVHTNASAVWPPTGVALAALLVFGMRVWPAILVGAFLVNLTTAGTIATSAAIAVGNTLESVTGAYLVVRFAGGTRAFDSVRGILKFTVLAAVVATTISATAGTSTLVLAGLAQKSDYGSIWLTWWLGDATGALVVAPVLVLAAIEPAIRWEARRLGEAALLVVGLVITGVAVFQRADPPPTTFLCVPFPLWAAFRFGRRESAVATLLLSVLAVWGAVRGVGPFARTAMNDSLLYLQVFMGGLTVTCLIVATVVAESQRVEHDLRVARDELEATVLARTDSLSQAVKALESEVVERTRAEHELRESEVRMRGLLEAAPDAMVVVDERGTIVEISAQVGKLFGYSRQEILGRPVERLVPDTFRARHESHRGVYSHDPRIRSMGEGLELYALRRDNTQFPVEISLSPVATDQGLLVMAAIRDISERKAVELKIRRMNVELERRVRERTGELERSNEALKQFAYAASHDLQEPLRTMGNYAELLSRRYRGRLDADADVFLGFVVEGAEWMHQLLQGLLEYSRVESRPAANVPTSMDRALEQALSNLRAAIADTGARVASESLPTAPADDVQMVQLFQNLIGNAIKFRREGIAPDVRVDASEKDGEFVFAVRDNGIGLDPRHAERIFAIFQRLHRRQEYPGTGVGLAICKKIVERHGGRIWVESDPGSGSTFFFTLPQTVQETA